MRAENDRPMLGKTENDRPMLGKTENDRPMLDKLFGLEEGTCYLVRGKKAETSYLLFQGIVERGTPGLCITTMYPEKVRSRYSLASVPVWWISFVPGDQHYAPNAIGILAKVIEGFVDQNPAGCVVLLDGVESIMNNIAFDKEILELARTIGLPTIRRVVQYSVFTGRTMPGRWEATHGVPAWRMRVSRAAKTVCV